MRASLKNVLHARSYRSADCNTDHSSLCRRIRLQPKRFHRAKKQGNPRIDVSKMSQPNLMSQFAEDFEREFGAPQPNDYATEKGEIVRDSIHAPHSHGYLREKDLNDSLLVWRQVDRNETRHRGSSRLSAKPWLSTNGHPAKGTCRFSEVSEARFNKPRGDVQTSIGHSSARIYRQPP